MRLIMEIIFPTPNPNVEKTQSKQVNSVGEMGEYIFSLEHHMKEKFISEQQLECFNTVFRKF